MTPRAVILAGGKGTRLQPFSLTFPKPLVPIGDMPVLELLLRQLHRCGVRDVTLALGHLAELIRAFLAQHKTGALADMNFSFVEETEPLGTAGALALIPELTETFLVLNGDLLTNLDFQELIRFHRASAAELTIASYVKKVQIDLGVLELDDRSQLVGYVEKPEKEYRVSMGVYVYEPSVLNRIARGRYLDFPDLVLRLLREKRPVAVYPFDGLWLDIGRIEDYARAQEMFAENRSAFLR
ncbi:MAG: sugar phosphate nucleotidyltransferase [Candidatus Sumerlaeota bacterium]|nr:sugar phosphate nucleotidyltransferase [Candidatus Sumerlaeota bacterium]